MRRPESKPALTAIRRDIARRRLGLARDSNGLIGGLALLDAPFQGSPLTFDKIAALPPATLRALADAVKERMRSFGNCPWEVDALHLLAGDPVTVSTLVLPPAVLKALELSPARPGPAPTLRITADSIVDV